MPVQVTADAEPIGSGAQRAVAFGGGGVWFIAWMVGYAKGLLQGGVDISSADVSIGTSAGAIVGASVMGGKLQQFSQALEQLGKDPSEARRVLSFSLGAPSQNRATSVMGGTTEINPATVQEIGRAAMASRNAPDADYVQAIEQLPGLDAWPAGHHASATDCYTGEPLLVGAGGDITVAQAAAASSSLPGANGPTWLGDRLCMDGGVSTSSTHAEVLAGAKAVLIMGMFDFEAHPPRHVNPAFGMSERINPGTAEREAAALRAQGSAVHVAIANPDPQTDFMDPATIGPAMAEGIARGQADVAALAKIW